MPELAEVEYFRRRWDPGISERIRAVKIHPQKRIFRETDTRALVRQLTGARFLRSVARGKQILLEFSGNNLLGLHLGMTGNLRIEKPDFRAGKHDHLVLEQAERSLVFRDSRQFGRVRFHHGSDAPPWWRASIPEIVERGFDHKFVDEFLRRHKKAPIKAVLLMQSGFPGIGNWMADEILWRAKIRPATYAGKLTRNNRAALLKEAKFVARESLRTLGRDFSDPPKSWLIHQRWKAGGICPKHKTKLRRATIGGRTTAWCPRCQR
jgi:formamidopyrimidine-DNA glycosylase